MGIRLILSLTTLLWSSLSLAQNPANSPFTDTPERLQAWAKESRDKDKETGHILLHALKIELDEAGRMKRQTHRIVPINDDRDVQHWSSLNVSWKKAFEDRPIINVRVIRPDGEVRLLNPATIVEAPAGEVESGIYSDAIILKILPPGLSPGSILELIVTEQENKSPFPSGRYEQSPLRSYWPIDRMEVNLSWHPSHALRYKWPEGIKLKKTEGKNAEGWSFLTLKGEQLAAEPMTEALSPMADTNSSFLEISSAKSWSQAAAEYQGIVDKQIASSKKIPALLKKIKQGHDTPEEIIAAVAFYVQKEIRYTSLAFGEASIVPRSPDETLERGYGDCKDKATLAYALLKEAGILSRVALLHTAPTPAQSDDMPGLDRFNHVILAVPLDKKLVWIDLTAEYFKPDVMPPGVAGQKALLAGPEGRELVTIPQSRSADNRISIHKTYTLSRLGTAKLLRTETATGIFDAFYRRSLATSNAKEILKEFESSIDPQITLDSAKSEDFKDYSKAVSMEGQFQNAGTADVWPAGTQIFAFPHQMFTGMPSVLDPLNERDVRGKILGLKKQLESRQESISLPFPFQREYIFRYQLPAHLDFQSKPDPTKIDLGPASLTLKTKECGKACYEFQFIFDTGSQTVWSVKDAQAYAEGLSHILDDKLYTISVKPKAFILSEQGKLREAIQYAQKAVQSKEGQAADRLTLGQLLQRIGLNEEAQQLAREAAKSQPQEKRILLHAGELLIHGENMKDCSKGSACPEARTLYEQALKLDPSDRFALRTLPLILIYNQNGLRYGKGADMQKADAAFAKAMKSALSDDQDFFNTYLQHLTFTGQWIAMDQALRKPPESMPPAIASAWRVITLIGNQHNEEAKQELDQLLTKSDGGSSMQGLIKELMQDRRYKEGSQLFQMLKDRLPQVSAGASEALLVMEPCPEEPTPNSKLSVSLQHYICTMLSPDSSLTQGQEFIPEFAAKDADYKKYFEKVEWDRRLENSRSDPTLPPYFLIDSASTAYDIKEIQKLQDGTLIHLNHTKVFAASPFASAPIEENFEPSLLAVQEGGKYHFISLDTPSVLSLLWFRAQSRGQEKAAGEYAKLLGDLLDRSLKAQEDVKKPGPDSLHYRDILKNFRPLLQGNIQEQELGAAIFSPVLLNEKAVQLFDRALQSKKLKPEQAQLLEVLAIGRLITLKKTAEALKRLNQRSADGPMSFSLVQTMLELAKTGEVQADDLQAMLVKLEASEFDERLSLLAEIKNLVGDQKGAEQVYQQWLKNPSPNGLTENNVAWFYFTSGRTDQKALKLAQSASDMAKQSVANLNTLASIQAELGMTNEAIATQLQYRNLLGDRDLGAADDLVTAINAEKMGLSEAALKRLRKIQVDPDSIDLKNLLSLKIHQLEKAPKTP